MEDEEPWIEDGDDNTNVSQDNDEDEEDYRGIDLFADTCSEFKVTFNKDITVNLKGVHAKYPMLLQSTGLTLWKSSKILCSFLCENPSIVSGKKIIELGAGLGLAGIVAHKLGAQKVLLTDGDTDTLENMRDNVSANSRKNDSGDENDCTSNVEVSILCKQLRWGRNVADFRNKWSSEGFDVVMGSDIIYAKEYIKELFQTVSLLLSSAPGSLFLVSHMKRNPNLSFDYIYACAKESGFQWTGPEGESEEGIYTFFQRS